MSFFHHSINQINYRYCSKTENLFLKFFLLTLSWFKMSIFLVPLFIIVHISYLIYLYISRSTCIWKHCNFPFLDKSTIVPFILAEGVEIHILTSNGEQSVIRISWGGGGFWILWSQGSWSHGISSYRGQGCSWIGMS